MKYISLLFLVLFPLSFLFAKESKNNAKELLYGFAGKMNFDKGWKLESTGWKYDEDKIQRINIGFRVASVPDLETARSDILDLSQAFLSYMNSNEKNAQYFLKFPLSLEDLNLNIAYVDSDGLFRKDGNICFVILNNSKLDFSKKGEKKLDSIHQESYADAIKCVKCKETRKWLKSPTPDDTQKARESSLKIFSDE